MDISWTKEGFFEHIYKGLTLFIRLSLLLTALGAAHQHRLTIIFISLFTFFLTFAPNYLKKRYNFGLPLEFELVIVIFLYFSLFLGEVHNYYVKYWWWDLLLHASSGIAFGFLGFIILYVLYRCNRFTMRPFYISLFAFTFAIALGAIWEILEFTIDIILNTNMQKSGLLDTMTDLVLDTFGAALASILGYFYLKGGESRIMRKVLDGFIDHNPRFFHFKKEKHTKTKKK